MKYILRFTLYSGLFWSCTNPEHHPDTHKLPMDSSMIIILESTHLLDKSCLPICWPQDFSTKKSMDQYIAYVWDSTYKDRIDPKFFKKGHEKRSFSYMEFDSAFHPLLECLNNVEKEKIKIQDVRLLSRYDVRIGLVNDLIGKLSDNVLGYLQVSSVVVNKSKDKGVFFYSLIGVHSKSWVVSVKKKSGRWQIVNQYLLGTS